MAMNIDPNAPTREEAMAHNMKVAKANLASDIVRSLAQSGRALTADEAANWAISATETIIDTYMLSPQKKSELAS